jgi:hypothetical protein
MNDKVQFILSLSIALPVIAGIIRLKVIDQSYYPFIVFLCAGCIMEFLPFYLYPAHGRNVTVAVVNLYALFEAMVLTWLFYSWSLFKKDRKFFQAVLICFFVLWLVLTFLFQSTTGSNYAFRVLYSVAIIIFSVSMINKLVITERGTLLKSPKFIISICLIIFYTFFALTNVTRLSYYSSKASSVFIQELQYIPAWSNFITNLIYTLAILWMPRKKSFINPF